MQIYDPFIVENGGAIVIPKDYFPFDFTAQQIEERYLIIQLGMNYREIRDVLLRIKQDTGIQFRGFGDMPAEEVSKLTGLGINAARRAKKREYDETLFINGTAKEIRTLLHSIKQAGLNYTYGGKLFHAMGDNDKGKAANILINLFRRKLPETIVAGIGDSLNDLPLLSAVDIPILLQKSKGIWENFELEKLHKIARTGPAGWNQAITEIIYTYL